MQLRPHLLPRHRRGGGSEVCTAWNFGRRRRSSTGRLPRSATPSQMPTTGRRPTETPARRSSDFGVFRGLRSTRFRTTRCVGIASRRRLSGNADGRRRSRPPAWFRTPRRQPFLSVSGCLPPPAITDISREKIIKIYRNTPLLLSAGYGIIQAEKNKAAEGPPRTTRKGKRR